MKRNILIMLVLFLTLALVGCRQCASIDEERKAHSLSGERYIPMLKGYIEKDTEIDDRLKKTYYLDLDTWLELIRKKWDEPK